MLADLVDIDCVSLTQDLQFLTSDLTGAADGKARAREGVTPDEACGQAKLMTQRADLVLEQLAQRFDQFQAHLFGQPAHIVVRFDRDGRPAAERHGFDHIGVKRALREEFGILNRVGVFLEHVNEQPPDGFAFDLGVAHAFQLTKKQVGFVGMDQVDVVVIAEHGHDLFSLVLAQQPVIDKDAGELIANRLMQQDRGDRAVHTTRKTTDDLLIAHLFADLRNRFFAISAHGPVALEPGKPHEVLIERLAVRRVMHLGVELHRIKTTVQIGGDCERRAGGGAVHLETRSDFRDMVAMAHPDLFAARAVHEPTGEEIGAGV